MLKPFSPSDISTRFHISLGSNTLSVQSQFCFLNMPTLTNPTWWGEVWWSVWGTTKFHQQKTDTCFLNPKWYSWVNSLLCCRLIRIIFSVESCWIHLFVVKLQFLRYERLSGWWWFQPHWNILVSWDAQYMEKCSKPPISCNLVITKSRCFAFLTDVVLKWLPMFVAPNSSPHPPWWVG